MIRGEYGDEALSFYYCSNGTNRIYIAVQMYVQLVDPSEYSLVVSIQGT